MKRQVFFVLVIWCCIFAFLCNVRVVATGERRATSQQPCRTGAFLATDGGKAPQRSTETPRFRFPWANYGNWRTAGDRDTIEYEDGTASETPSRGPLELARTEHSWRRGLLPRAAQARKRPSTGVRRGPWKNPGNTYFLACAISSAAPA